MQVRALDAHLFCAAQKKEKLSLLKIQKGWFLIVDFKRKMLILKHILLLNENSIIKPNPFINLRLPKKSF